MLSIRGSELASLWASLALLLVLSRLLARGAARLGAPPVVGALAAGVLLSSDLLGGVWPAATHWLFPQNQLQGHLLGGITNLGLLLLCFVLGMDTDVPLLRSRGRQLTLTTGASFVVPLVAGAVLAAMLPSSFIGASGNRTALVLLLGAAIAVSSLPVIAWMLRELGLYRSPVGQLAVGAATIQDGLGFVLLSVGIAVASGGSRGRLFMVTIGLVSIVLLAVGGGQRAIDFLLRRTDPQQSTPTSMMLTVMIATMLAVAAVTQVVHLDGAFGAFLAGVVFGRSAYHRHDAAQILDTLTAAVFAPIYFASAGVDLQLDLLARRDVALGLLAVLAVGAVAKSAGSLISTAGGHRSWRERVTLATVLNGRGAMQVIIASVALRRAVISSSAYTVIVTAAIVTSLLAAPLVRVISRGERPSPVAVSTDTDPAVG